MAENATKVPNVTDAADGGGDSANAPNVDNNEIGGSPTRNPLNRCPCVAENNAIGTPTA